MPKRKREQKKKPAGFFKRVAGSAGKIAGKVAKSVGKAAKGAAKVSRTLLKKVLADPSLKEKLRSAASTLKGTLKGVISAECPQCGKALDFVVNTPVAKKIFEKGIEVVNKGCPECGEALDIVINA
jgi:transcription initiation factor IIE alpha subunit